MSKPIGFRRKGSFNKGAASAELHELMVRYAQDNQISKMIGCVIKGCDIDYNDGACLLIACYLGKTSLLKAVLGCGASVGFRQALAIAEAAADERLLVLLNEHINKFGLDPKA